MTYKGQIILSILVMAYLTLSFAITAYDVTNSDRDKLKNTFICIGSLLSLILVSNLI